MSLFLAGDFADPTASLKLDSICDLMGKEDRFLINLEGPVLAEDERSPVNNEKINLYSSPDFLKLFSREQLICSLANNHINDFHDGLKKTEQFLNKNNIDYLGTENKNHFAYSNFDVLAFNSILTLPQTNAGISQMNRRAIDEVKKRREKNKDGVLVVICHFGFVLSDYPIIADRNFCKAAIEAGADYVIGHHPHIVQGYENYQNGHVFYSIGNFALPQVPFLDKTLTASTTKVNRGALIEIENKNDFKIHTTEMNESQTKVSYGGTISLNEFKKDYGISKKAILNYDKFYRENNTLPRYYPNFKKYGTLSFYLKYRYVLFSQYARKMLIKSKIYNPY